MIAATNSAKIKGLVVREAATETPIPHTHQATGCSHLAGRPGCSLADEMRRHALPPLPFGEFEGTESCSAEIKRNWSRRSGRSISLRMPAGTAENEPTLRRLIPLLQT